MTNKTKAHPSPNKAAKKKVAPKRRKLKSTTYDPAKTPMSELPKLKDGTQEEIVADLLVVASIDTDKVITRNYYRINGHYAESAWNRFFGTFEEFKRQSGIKLTRHQHKMERDIAKHASKDAMRAMNVDKSDYEGKYLKPSGKRFKDILICSDVHDEKCDPFYRRLFIQAAKRLQPEVIVFNGDIFDLTEFSKFTQDPRDYGVVRRITWVHAFMEDIREVAPDAEFWFIEGNHEFRMMRHLAEATPSLRDILSQLHGFTVPKLLGLDQFEVNYVARSDLAAFTERDIKIEIGKNWKVFFETCLASHYPKDRNKGMPGWNGHHHKHITWPMYSPIYGSYEWHQIGCGQGRTTDWCDAEIWNNGFLIAHVDTQEKRVQFENVNIQDFAVLGGTWYEREPSEIIVAGY